MVRLPDDSPYRRRPQVCLVSPLLKVAAALHAVCNGFGYVDETMRKVREANEAAQVARTKKLQAQQARRRRKRRAK